MLKTLRRGQPPNGQFTINRQSPQARGLVNWWSLARLADTSNLIINGERLSNTNAIFAPLGFPSYYFSGTAFMEINPGSVSPPFSLSCWAYLTSYGGGTETMLALEDSASATSRLRLCFHSSAGTPRGIRWNTYGSSTISNVDASLNVTTGAWYHCVGILKSWSSQLVYVNGGNTASGSTNIGSFTIDKLSVGQWYKGGSPADRMIGNILDVRIYNRALSAAEIRALYDPSTRWDLYQPVAPARYWLLPQAVAAGGSYSQSIGGTISPAGGVVKSTAKILAGGVSAAGEVIKQTAVILQGGITTAGTVARQTAVSLAGVLSAAGGITKQAVIALAGSLQTAGTVVTQLVSLVRVALAGAVGMGGEVTKQVKLPLTGVLSAAGTIARKTILTPLQGLLSPAGGIVKRARKTIVGSLQTAGAAATRFIQGIGGIVGIPHELTLYARKNILNLVKRVNELFFK